MSQTDTPDPKALAALVARQACNALPGFANHGNDHPCGRCDTIRMAIEAAGLTRALPSADPERVSYEWCREAEAARDELARVRSVVDALAETVEMAAAEIASRGKGGQSVGPSKNDFHNARPSMIQQLRWWVRALRESDMREHGGSCEGGDVVPATSTQSAECTCETCNYCRCAMRDARAAGRRECAAEIEREVAEILATPFSAVIREEVLAIIRGVTEVERGRLTP